MKRLRAAIAAPMLVILAVSCASVGAGDPLLVRTEDTLTNSLSVYEALMEQHFVNSTRESAATYKAIEEVRTKFPIAWQAVYDARALYKAGSTGGADKLTTALEVLRALVHQAALLAGGRG